VITVVIELPRLNQEYAGARAACLLHMTVIMQTILAYTTPVQAYTRSQRNQGSRAICSKPCRCNVTCALDHFGQLHIAFNNAGIGGEDLFADDPGDWTRIIDVDLTAVIDATRIAFREIKRPGHGGLIINTASLIVWSLMASAPVYAAVKAGVVNVSGSLAYLQRKQGFASTRSELMALDFGWIACRSCARRVESSSPRTSRSA
jgi:short chain dehydrogenase